MSYNLKNELLSVDDIQKLAQTHCNTTKSDIQKAFLLCCHTGLRYCDIVNLKYGNMDFPNKLLLLDNGVIVPLNDVALSLIGEAQKDADAKVFRLPAYANSLRALARWAKASGINKRLNWQCARHSFAANLMNGSVNSIVVQNLIDSDILQCTNQYMKAADRLKKEASDYCLNNDRRISHV